MLCALAAAALLLAHACRTTTGVHLPWPFVADSLLVPCVLFHLLYVLPVPVIINFFMLCIGTTTTYSPVPLLVPGQTIQEGQVPTPPLPHPHPTPLTPSAFLVWFIRLR